MIGEGSRSRSKMTSLPKDWLLTTAGQIGRFKGGSGFPISAQGRTDEQYPFFKVSDMNHQANKVFMEVSRNSVSETMRKRLGATAFAPNSIVFAKVGAAIFLERKRILARLSCLDNNMAAYAITDDGIDYLFIYYFFLSIKFGGFANTTALSALGSAALNSIQVLIPPTKTEQQAIAQALSDADALIDSLEQLLAKKRLIKQGAMQQLLTGKKRLPGFTLAWRAEALGNLAFPRKLRAPAIYGKSPDFCIDLDSLEPATGRLLKNSEASEGSSPRTVFQRGDVLFGKLRAYLRKYWHATRDGVCSTEIWALVADIRLLSSAFLFQIVQTNQFIESASLAYGTHMPRSDWNILRKLPINLPPLEEQIAIADALSTFEAELAATASKLSKARALKQGMMQQLLTGRIRLL